MKFAILLLLWCCAVTLARPDGSKEVSKKPKHSSEEVKHSGEHSKEYFYNRDSLPPRVGTSARSFSGSSESKESNEKSGDKSSNESGKKDDGGSVTEIPGIGLPLPNVQQVELLLDRVVEIVATIFGLRSVHGYVDLIHLIESNPLSNIVWTIVVQPFLKNITHYQNVIISFLENLQAMIVQYFPIFRLFIPLQLPKAIIQFVFRILYCIAQIFSSTI